jgi:4-amino-4-deoxy-L-arabinose transferase-like glycosyltransferase
MRMTDATTEPIDDEPAHPDTGPSWNRALAVGLAAFVVSRLCVIAGTAVRAAQVTVDAREDGEAEPGALSVISGVLTSWDGKWYLEIVRGGYPGSVPPDITYNQLEARAAFFPLYPWTVRVLDAVLPGGDTLAALLLNFVLGALSVVLVGLLARRLYGIGVAARAMTLYAVFPGSVVLSMAYSEAMMIVLAATCLLLLVDERWWLAGIAAALTTATRPNGIAIVAACAVAAFLAIRRDRQWTSLVAVALAPIGFVLFQWYVGATAGERGVWFRVQREAWAEGTSFGATAVTNTIGFFTSPLSSPTDALTALSMLALGGMAYCAWKVRLAWPLVAFAAAVVALMLLPETVTARPRFLFTAFPLFIAVAAWWPEPKDEVRHASWEYAGWDLTLVACGAGLAALTGLYAVFGVIP